MSTLVRERLDHTDAAVVTVPRLSTPTPVAIPTRVPTPTTVGARAGFRDILPVTVAIVPFAMVLGVTIDASVVPDAVGAVMAALLYAGSANFAALSVVDAGGTALTAIFTALVVNARFTMYGAALSERFRSQPRWFRWFAPWFIIDQTFALTSARDEQDPAWFRGYWFAAAATIGIVYTSMVVTGILLGTIIPTDIGLEFTVPAMFMALGVGQLRDRPALAAAIAGAAVTALAMDLPHGLGLLVGAVAGAATGAIARRMS
jgi:4-azaleucine resistance transporter AzlC